MKIIELLNKRPTLSFEIFPPKNHDADIASIYQTIDALAQLKPDFISVTYGAGGSTTKNTVEIASHIVNHCGIEAVAHLTCIDSTKQQVLTILEDLRKNNIQNILSLRGDYPSHYDENNAPHDFHHANELNTFINENYADTFCLSNACYPEGHMDSLSMASDLENLKKKVASGADYFITQVFFDNNYYYELVKSARRMGITIPIIAGIMPAVSPKSLKKIAKISGCVIPYKLSHMIDRFEHNPQAMREAGLHYATDQIIDLMSNDVDGIHIYTMNKPDIAASILERMKYIRNEFKDD